MTPGEEDRPPAQPWVGPPVVGKPVRTIDYQRPSIGREGRGSLPYGAGYVIGFGVFAACCGGGWMAGRSSPSYVATLILLVPLSIVIISGALQVAFGWRGVLAGALTAMCLTLLTCGIGVAVICGGLGK